MFRTLKNIVPHIAAIAVGATTFKVLNDNDAPEEILITGTGLAAGLTDTAVTIGMNMLDTKNKKEEIPENPDEDKTYTDIPDGQAEENTMTLADALEYFEEELQEAAGLDSNYEQLLAMVNCENPEVHVLNMVQMALQDMFDYDAFQNYEGATNRARVLYIDLGIVDPTEDSEDENDGEPDGEPDASDGDTLQDEPSEDGEPQEEPVEDNEPEEEPSDDGEHQDQPEVPHAEESENSEQFAQDFVQAAEQGDDQVQQLLHEMDGDDYGSQASGGIEGSVLDFVRGEAEEAPPASEEKQQRSQRRSNSKKDKDKQTRNDRRFK